MKELALHMLDIAENSVWAGARRLIMSISLDKRKNLLMLSIEDNGEGMSGKVLEMTKDPFFTSRTTRNIGMGIPLFRQHAEMTGGSLEIDSEKGKGTILQAKFYTGHDDIQPLGDIEGCWTMLASSYPDVEVILKCTTSEGSFELNSTVVKAELAIENIQGNELTSQLKRLIRNNIEELELGWKNFD